MTQALNGVLRRAFMPECLRRA
ncbi:PsiF family protein [Stenotrophomonas sp. SXG-1]